VLLNGNPASFTHGDHRISAALDSEPALDDILEVRVDFTVGPQPAGGRIFCFDNYNGHDHIWTFSEPFGARRWWPCKDDPGDKADSVDLVITVPDPLIVASNGTLRSVEDAGDGRTTYHWHEGYPIATYLVSLAIYPYFEWSDQYISASNGTMPIQFYTFSDTSDFNPPELLPIYLRIDEMIGVMAEWFGEYPFLAEKYGTAEWTGGGAMEHQTLTSMAIVADEYWVVHELAHQWWGDMITCASFHHIWLNEGFASYSGSLWEEAQHGMFAYHEAMSGFVYYDAGTIYVEEPSDWNVLAVIGYIKGAWVLHMLRHVVGDATFFQILRAYGDSPELKYGTATTEQFQAICEQVSGMNLEKFFHQWIHEEYYPRYAYSWDWTQNGLLYDIELEIQQKQTNHIFWMPIDITVATSSGDTTVVVWDSLQTQTFSFSVSAEPVEIELDRNDWILKTINLPFTDPAFDQGILLVNGLPFDASFIDAWGAYNSRAFWGDYPISFWDCFEIPLEEYPPSLPEPLGFGVVPTEVLSQYSTVIWVLDDYRGDLNSLRITPILEYLEAGGNLLLVGKGYKCLDHELEKYLGISWAESSYNTINNCISVYPGLTDMTFNNEQARNSVFDTSLVNSESTLLFVETASFSEPRGLGVWHKPAAGGTFKSDGGQFVYISGRPDRYDADLLQSNIEYILEHLFNEPAIAGNSPSSSARIINYRLSQNYPNPFNPASTIRYDLPEGSDVSLVVYDILGQEVTRLVKAYTEPGYHQVIWDGRDIAGREVPSGIYIARLVTPEYSKSIKMVLLK
jgi:hypothetical protein